MIWKTSDVGLDWLLKEVEQKIDARERAQATQPDNSSSLGMVCGCRGRIAESSLASRPHQHKPSLRHHRTQSESRSPLDDGHHIAGTSGHGFVDQLVGQSPWTPTCSTVLL